MKAISIVLRNIWSCVSAWHSGHFRYHTIKLICCQISYSSSGLSLRWKAGETHVEELLTARGTDRNLCVQDVFAASATIGKEVSVSSSGREEGRQGCGTYHMAKVCGRVSQNGGEKDEDDRVEDGSERKSDLLEKSNARAKPTPNQHTTCVPLNALVHFRTRHACNRITIRPLTHNPGRPHDVVRLLHTAAMQKCSSK